MSDVKSPIIELKGVGVSQSKYFSDFGLETIRDFLFHIPFRYTDTSQILSIEDFKSIQEGTFLGQIVDVKNIYTRFKKKITKVKISDGISNIDLTYFNQTYLSKALKVGDWYIFDGKYTKKGVFNPKYEKYTGDLKEQKHLGKIIGIYHETEKISSRTIRNILINNKQYIEEIEDPISKNILKEYNLCTLQQALKYVHFPKDVKDIEKGRERLGFDEMFRIGIRIERDILERSNLKSISIKEDIQLTEDFLKTLPYQLTKDQLLSLKDILEDISKSKPMNRLLNGDVGSGKTVVSAIAILQCIRNGYSAIVMAPTTVLAQQHFETFNKLLKDFNINIELCISNKKIEGDSKAKLIVGTHAILYKQELPKNIDLVIIDEQHRFGVKQREELLLKTKHTPHYLTMTATPIPRSLTEIIFGNIDVSVIKEKPHIRKDILTYYVPYIKRGNCFEWIRERIEKNKEEQAFIVYPLIEESAKIDAKSVLTEYENLSKNIFKDLKCKLLHGRLSEKEKDDILKSFKEKDFNILVTTSVIEVGIDIPDATIIVIENAERFGLAQLHQLRGRVGRSDKQSYCYVISSEKYDNKEENVNRLKYFASHNSGFDVAEYDLNHRGPGEVYGLRQSGIPQFKVANISDIKLLKKARDIAKDIVNKDNTDLEYIKENLFK